jgi:surfeit locus 1 family protein
MGAPPSIAFGPFELRVRPWPALAAAAGVALTLALGNWQLGRAQYKAELHQRTLELGREPPVALGALAIRADEVALRRIEVRGRFEPRFAIYLDNRLHRGQPGYHVLMPLRITGSGKHVLVNRGWVAAGRDRTRPTPVKTPDHEVVVRGMAYAPSERYIELSANVAEGSIWQNLSLERYRTSTELDVHPIVVQQESAADDGLVREWPAPDSARNIHLAYALQWFSLGAAILVCYLVLNVRRRTQAPGPR